MTAASDSGIRVGINAQKLITSRSYHTAGSSRYLYNLLYQLRRMAAPEQFVSYLGQHGTPAGLEPTERFHLRWSQWPTANSWARIIWEQLVLPRDMHHDRITLHHGAVNAIPVTWSGTSVVTILDLTFLIQPRWFNRANRTYLKWAVRSAARKAKAVVAISEATRRDVIRLLGVEPHRVVTIPCGADARFRPHLDPTELRAFRDANDLPEHFMLYLGTIEPRKNLIRLMDAYAEVQRRVREPWPLILAGGAGWGVEEIRAHADRLRLGPRLRFAGYVEEAEIPLWYNAADLFVYPSEYEGFGLPALEALACGTPVVTSDRSSLPEVVGECAILVNPSDPTSIADGIVRAIDDAELRHRLSQGGPERAKRFSWERMAEETLAVYRSVSAA